MSIVSDGCVVINVVSPAVVCTLSFALFAPWKALLNVLRPANLYAFYIADMHFDRKVRWYNFSLSKSYAKSC